MTMANISPLSEHTSEHLEPKIETPLRNGTNTIRTVIVFKPEAVVRSTSCPPNVAVSTQTRHSDIQFAPQSLLPTEKDMQLGPMIQPSSFARGQNEMRSRANTQKEIGLTTPTFGQPSIQQIESASRQQYVARNAGRSNNGAVGTHTPTRRQPNSQQLATVSKQYDVARSKREERQSRYATPHGFAIPLQSEKDGKDIVTACRQGDTETTFEGQNATSTTTHFKNIANTESANIASDTSKSANTYSYNHIHPTQLVKAATSTTEIAGEQTKAKFKKSGARDTRHPMRGFYEGQARDEKPEGIAFLAHAESSNHFLAPQMPSNAPIPPRARRGHTNPFKRSLNDRRQPANFLTHTSEPWPNKPPPSQELSTTPILNHERSVGINTLEDSQGRSNRKFIRGYRHVSDSTQILIPDGSVTTPVLPQELPIRRNPQNDSHLQSYNRKIPDLDRPAYASDPSQIRSTQTFDAVPIQRQDHPVQNNYPNISQSQNSLSISLARPAYDNGLNPIQTPPTVIPAPIMAQEPTLETIYYEGIQEISAHTGSPHFQYRIEPRLLFVCPDMELSKEAPSAIVLRPDPGTHLTLSSNGTIFRPMSSWQKSFFELWSVKEQRITAYFPRGLEGTYSLTCMAFDSTGSILATGDEIGCITVWGINGRVRQRVPQSSAVNSLAISADGRWLAVNLQGTVKLSDMANNNSKVIHSSSAAGRTTTNFAFSPTNNLLAFVSSSNSDSIRLDLIDLVGLERIWRTNFVIRADNHPPCLAFSPDGRRIALAAKNYILLIEVSPPRVTYKVKGAVKGLVFSRDSRYLLGSGNNNNILVWEWTTGRSRNLFTGRSFYSDVAVSPDNCLIGIGKVSVVGSAYEGRYIYELASTADIKALFDDQFAKGMIPSNPQPGKEYILRPNLYAFYEESVGVTS
ncbi:hypothetical protein K505DRAFT_48233 [Melanomma pulvis-pyrius CBS 109.77]|uniref:WD40 repeat-like protein n=1 Tax=Melanomma pulvis-pyrius CBS 109.77 TaxID=1314802 RepID=A0A6A6X955_9PLEO|nr:hypothetical protein K505DRAFT_48233 [Melanomma pulvis-pyrius CBS 109.77]